MDGVLDLSSSGDSSGPGLFFAVTQLITIQNSRRVADEISYSSSIPRVCPPEDVCGKSSAIFEALSLGGGEELWRDGK